MRTKSFLRSVTVLLLTLMLVALRPPGAGAAVPPPPRELRPALASVNAATLLEHTRRLASDEFEGRAPGTPGEERTVAYLIEQFRAAGLRPGNPDGSWTQAVPLLGLTAEEPQCAYQVGGREVTLAFPEECVLWSKRFQPEARVEQAEAVFVGYGVEAPEFQWDDFKDVDVRGKTLIMLINDPPIPTPGNPDVLDPRKFKGAAMTYYGRWTYKFESAARKGAAAALIVHEEGPAGYPWSVVKGSNARENFDLRASHGNRDRAAIEGWLPLPQARRLFAAAGYDFDTLKQRAARPDFKPVPLGVTTRLSLKNRMREVDSRNVVARLEGSDPRLRAETILFTAHWDHLGRDPKLTGDQIFNGALDNASGVAELLELARVFAQLRPAPRRSLLFLSVTAEEKGLLGARYYATQPLYPLVRTLADFNLDAINPWGRTRDLQVIGAGNSTLEDVLRDAAAAQGRVVEVEAQPEKGHFYRSDHFELAKVGVPALYFKAGMDYVGKVAGYGQRKADEYVAQDYHKVTDEVKPDWDFSGAVEDTQLLIQVAWQVAQAKTWPVWKEGSEFKQRREEALRAAGVVPPR